MSFTTVATRDKKKKKTIAIGQLEACCHNIRWWYDCNIKKSQQTDDFFNRLQDAAEQRAREMIAEDYREGELCYYDVDTDQEYRGWWQIG